MNEWRKLLDPEFIKDVVINNIIIGQSFIEKKEIDGELYGRIVNLFTGCECGDHES